MVRSGGLMFADAWQELVLAAVFAGLTAEEARAVLRQVFGRTRLASSGSPQVTKRAS